ncbi:MAG: SDR family NAD(P)-dependent oxidoreductase [bacterium]
MKLTGLENKRVLVTGASGGIGAGIARAFSEAGAKVVVHYRTREKEALQLVDALGGEAVSMHADLRSAGGLRALVAEVWRLWGGLDVLVNNAGVVLKAAILDADERYWDDVLNVNLRAPYLLSREVALRWREQGETDGKVILHNTSIHGHKSTPWFSAYASSKAGLERLTEVQALEWAPLGIRVNAFAPGVVPVERTEEVLRASESQWMPHIPLGRFGRISDIASLALFLASDGAQWITGQSFVCDGGSLARMDLLRRPSPPLPAAPDKPVE